jgi:hypothetical protein
MASRIAAADSPTGSRIRPHLGCSWAPSGSRCRFGDGLSDSDADLPRERLPCDVPDTHAVHVFIRLRASARSRSRKASTKHNPMPLRAPQGSHPFLFTVYMYCSGYGHTLFTHRFLAAGKFHSFLRNRGLFTGFGVAGFGREIFTGFGGAPGFYPKIITGRQRSNFSQIFAVPSISHRFPWRLRNFHRFPWYMRACVSRVDGAWHLEPRLDSLDSKS